MSAEASRRIAVLPLGAHEQHGPHLPFETDAIIAEAVAARLSDRLAGKEEIEILPVEREGYSPEHMDYKGTRSLGYAQAVNRWIGIGEELGRRGCRRMVMLNAHGGNSPLMTIVATELRVRLSMLCVATSWTRFGAAEGLFPPEEISLGIHAGAIETSVMLALRPDLVRMEGLANFDSEQARLEQECRWLRAYGRHAFGWKMQDLNPAGAVGDARLASAAKGEEMLERAVEGLAELVGEVAAFDLSRLRNDVPGQGSGRL